MCYKKAQTNQKKICKIHTEEKQMNNYDVTQIRNIAFAGHNGSGKTSLASHISRNAIQNGTKAIYFAEEDFMREGLK